MVVPRLNLGNGPLPDPGDRDWWRTITDEQVAATSLDRWNLWCARDLPGSEELDVEATAETLHEWAAWIWHATRRNVHMFHAEPEEFRHSPATWCAYVVLWCCQTRFGVEYREEWRKAIPFDDSRKLFLNGVVGVNGRPGTGGTCANVPLVYVAIGRRLGYPLRVVRNYSHVWCRWDDPEGTSGFEPDVFNVEGTNGYAWHDDAYCRTLGTGIHPREEANGWYGRSLTPREEVGSFHLERGFVLERSARMHEAHETYLVAHRLWRPGGRPPEEVHDCVIRTGALLGLPLVPHDAERQHRWIEHVCETFGWEYSREERSADPDAFLPETRRPFRRDEHGSEEPARRYYEELRRHHREHGLKVTIYDVPALRERGRPAEVERSRRLVEAS